MLVRSHVGRGAEGQRAGSHRPAPATAIATAPPLAPTLPSPPQVVAIVSIAPGAESLAAEIADFVRTHNGAKVLGDGARPKVFDLGEGDHLGRQLGAWASLPGNPDPASAAYYRACRALQLVQGLAVRRFPACSTLRMH